MSINIKNFEDDVIWLHDNWDTLRAKYPDEWIGVQNQNVVAHNRDLGRLLSQLDDPSHTAVEYISSRMMESIL